MYGGLDVLRYGGMDVQRARGKDVQRYRGKAHVPSPTRGGLGWGSCSGGMEVWMYWGKAIHLF